MTEPINENQNAPHHSGDSEKKPDGPVQQVLPAVAKSELPPSHPKCCKSYKKKRDWFDYGKGVLEIAGLVVLCVYAAYTVKIYGANQKAADAAHDTLGEIQKQTQLMRQQLIGTQAAIVAIDSHMGVQPLPLRNNMHITIGFKNDGHVIAKGINLKLNL